MSERDLLPRRPFAVLPPEPGGFEAALARGRQRRRRAAGSTALASLVAIVLGFAVAAPNPNNASRLEFTEQTPHDLTRDVDSPVVADSTKLAPPELDAPAHAETGRAEGGTSIPQPSADQPRTAVPPPRPAGSRPRPARTLADPTKRSVPQGFTTCAAAAEGLRVAEAWCLQAFRVVSDEDPTDSFLQLNVCLSVNGANGGLNYTDSKQVDFVVTKQGSEEELWRWSHGAVAKQTPVHDEVGQGDCLQYEVKWMGRVDNDDHYIADPGTYVVNATSFAHELGESRTATTTFTVTDNS